MLKNIKKFLILILIFLVLLVLVLKVFKVENIILKRFYPIEYEEYVYKYSEEYGVDPLLMFSLIKAESNFKEDCVSSSNAIGLMQLMDSTAEEVAKNIKLEYNSEVTLYNPEENIRLGIKYFSELMKYYNQNYILSIAAYNAGIGNVANWIDKGIIKQDGSDAENIPFKETNNYVRKIINNYKVYKKLYFKE